MEVNVKKIISELTRRNWTQNDLATKTGLTRQAVGVILREKSTTIKTLNKLGNVLELDPKDLLI